MRGGAQAHLVEADDGYSYVLKATNNPQHRRILVNEWLCAGMLRYLQVATPETALVEVTAEFVDESPEFSLRSGSRILPIPVGWHFGSRFPGDPFTTSAYDFLPDALLPSVANLHDFRAMLVFDKWVSNADSRQAIFYRARVRRPQSDESPLPARPAFVALMVDHGFAFQGPNWVFHDAPRQGLYHRNAVYQDLAGCDGLQPWLDRVEHFPEDIIDRTVRSLPPEWIDREEDQFEALLARLLDRRSRIRALIEDTVRSPGMTAFPGWR